jgi:hypothetical protein
MCMYMCSTVYVCVCVCGVCVVWRGASAVRRSQHNFVESGLFVHLYIGSGIKLSLPGPLNKYLYPLIHSTNPYIILIPKTDLNL